MRWTILGFVALCSAASALPAADFDLSTRFTQEVFKNDKGESLKYRFLKPASLAPSAGGASKFPLVVFLHGAGERGDDNAKQLIHGVTKFATDEYLKKYPCFVIAPQCPTGKRWVEVDWSLDSHRMPETVSESLRLTMELIASLEKSFPIDSNRLYVTGLSMGGYGSWDAIQRFPERFAAAVPVCGGGDTQQAKKIAKIPVWAFHGAKDTAVKPQRSRDMIAAMKEAGGEPKYTEYPEVGHNSWVSAYNTPELYEWMFAQKLKK